MSPVIYTPLAQEFPGPPPLLDGGPHTVASGHSLMLCNSVQEVCNKVVMLLPLLALLVMSFSLINLQVPWTLYTLSFSAAPTGIEFLLLGGPE